MNQTLIFSIITAFIICLVMTQMGIPLLKRLRFGQNVRDDGPQTHLKKIGTPTMGGIFILISITLTFFIWGKGDLSMAVVVLLVTLGYGLIGFADDFIKIVLKRALGLRAYQKLIGQIGIAVIFSLYLYNNPHIGSSILIPFTSSYWDLGIFFIPFAAFVVVGTVNSVNLTDGLDGLATGITLIVAATLSIIFLTFSDINEAYPLLSINYSNAAVLAGALTGACLGFFRFNTNPAQIFMGDTGSLALGGAIASLALLLQLPLVLPIIGGIYMVETFSVIIQVIFFKKTGKRVFKMSPLHHHFELCGMPESRIVAFFMIATIILCLISLIAIRI